jgi:hypothetical protein
VNSYALVATHHKTGSVWMRTVFSSIARALEIPFVNLSRKPYRGDRFPSSAVVFDDHSKFTGCPWLLGDPRSRILHVIRDPRDVIISAMNYHRSAKENWLHSPRKVFDGLSYQQKINSLPDDFARYLFEMNKSSKQVIRDMQNWNYNRENGFECKYETLVADRGMELVTQALVHLGFDDKETEVSRSIFWDNSLFGALRDSRSDHIRSGEMRQWPAVFDRRLAEAFTKRFPRVLEDLGYEADDSWIASRCA